MDKSNKDWKNKLFYGDNLEVLRKYIKDETIDNAVDSEKCFKYRQPVKSKCANILE